MPIRIDLRRRQPRSDPGRAPEAQPEQRLNYVASCGEGIPEVAATEAGCCLLELIAHVVGCLTLLVAIGAIALTVAVWAWR